MLFIFFMKLVCMVLQLMQLNNNPSPIIVSQHDNCVFGRDAFCVTPVSFSVLPVMVLCVLP